MFTCIVYDGIKGSFIEGTHMQTRVSVLLG